MSWSINEVDKYVMEYMEAVRGTNEFKLVKMLFFK